MKVRTTSFCALDGVARKLLCWGFAYHEYASAYSVPDIVSVGAVDQDDSNGQILVRALTSDGLYHVGAVSRQPSCGALPHSRPRADGRAVAALSPLRVAGSARQRRRSAISMTAIQAQ